MTAWPERFGPWALVTGASDGIGRAIAQDLARRGLSLVLVARRRERLEALADELRREFRVAVRVHPADLGERAAVARLLDEVGDLEIGLLASCAGFGSSGPFLATDPAAELDMVEVNCTASLHLARVLGATMAGRGRGGILLMGSIVAFQGVPHAATYAATKAFVLFHGKIQIAARKELFFFMASYENGVLQLKSAYSPDDLDTHWTNNAADKVWDIK